MTKSQMGVIGLGVMGMNLALNIESKGYSVSVYDYWTDRTDEFSNKEAKDKNIHGSYSIEDLVASLEVPRKILLMVKGLGKLRIPSSNPLSHIFNKGIFLLMEEIHSLKIRIDVQQPLKNQVYTLLVQVFLVEEGAVMAIDYARGIKRSLRTS